MTHVHLRRLWTHNHGAWLSAQHTLHVRRLDSQPLTDKVRQWIQRHREQLTAELDPHPDLCWNCPADIPDYVDRYDELGRPWCHTCWALHVLDVGGLITSRQRPTVEAV